jgi:uncharacterized protein YkwD
VGDVVPLGRTLRDHRAADCQQATTYRQDITGPHSGRPERDAALMTVAPIALTTRPTPRRFALIVAVAFAITAVGLLVAPRPTDAWSSGQYNSTSEQQLVAMTNQSRAAAGLRSLRVDSTLTSVARSRSKDMIVRGYFSHNIPPSGKTVFSILDSKGYCYAIAGENIGWNNYPDSTATKTVHRMFMESPGHRSNILGKRWDVIGIGAYKGPTGKKMWTVLFADKCGGSSSGGTTTNSNTTKSVPKPKATPKPTPKPTPVPTPVRTMPPEPTDPVALGFGRNDRSNENGALRDDAELLVGRATTAPPPAGSLRVLDPATPPGLIDTIVGDVTGFFLGG